ncbi:MAG: lytic transglycosylase domain-containing protein [Pseudomonadota bacterium]
MTRPLCFLATLIGLAIPVHLTAQSSEGTGDAALQAALAEIRPQLRPTPIGTAIAAVKSGDWDRATAIAEGQGDVAADIIRWMRLRNGIGTWAEAKDFLARRSDWPGERFLRRQVERFVLREPDAELLAFFAEEPPQTPRAVLAHAAALTRAGEEGEAQANLVLAWRTMPMNATSQALFMAEHEALLRPHHTARLDAMLWEREHEEARQMFGLVSEEDRALAETRIALQRRAGDVNAMINALPASKADDPGLAADRFEWRIRKGLTEDAKTLLLARSTSPDALGRPEAWSNRRRALARGEMRSGDPELAYQLASQHFLEPGAHYADLEWLSGYIALRFLKDPARAYEHFLNHDSAVQSPISQGRAGYWQGRALEDMGDPEAAAVAYRAGARYQTSFYGLLAAEKVSVPFDEALRGAPPAQDWRSAPLAADPLFQAGLMLQEGGELTLAERFWTHLAEQLVAEDIALLGQAAIDEGQPHLAVMIGKRAARRGLTIAAPYYALHPLAEADLPMAPEMSLAIARRESEFDPVVVSGAGARGLMQLMPATAREVSSNLGLRALHTTDRLTADPVYNAQLGARYLAEVAAMFDGNVSMMSAAYNAGPSRPTRWMATYGDPRRGDIDIVDWVEMVPFRETRNYVMRVTESLPVYRARLGKDPLPVPFSQELIGSTLKAFAP